MIRQFFFSSLLLLSISISAQDPLIDSAKTHYDKADYKMAIENYQQILNKGFESGEIRYNLGNSFYRTNHIGKAILNYEKALNFLSGNEDVIFNLSLANAKKKDKFEDIPSTSLSNLFVLINKVIYFDFWAILSSIFIIGSGAIFIISKRNKNTQLSKYSIIIVSAGILIGLMSLQQKKAVLNTKNCIVINNQSNILSEPNSNSTILLEVNEGSKLKIIRTDENWLNVSTPSNDKGWIETINISEI